MNHDGRRIGGPRFVAAVFALAALGARRRQSGALHHGRFMGSPSKGVTQLSPTGPLTRRVAERGGAGSAVGWRTCCAMRGRAGSAVRGGTGSAVGGGTGSAVRRRADG